MYHTIVVSWGSFLSHRGKRFSIYPECGLHLSPLAGTDTWGVGDEGRLFFRTQMFFQTRFCKQGCRLERVFLFSRTFVFSEKEVDTLGVEPTTVFALHLEAMEPPGDFISIKYAANCGREPDRIAVSCHGNPSHGHPPLHPSLPRQNKAPKTSSTSTLCADLIDLDWREKKRRYIKKVKGRPPHAESQSATEKNTTTYDLYDIATHRPVITWPIFT